MVVVLFSDVSMFSMSMWSDGCCYCLVFALCVVHLYCGCTSLLWLCCDFVMCIVCGFFLYGTKPM